MHLLQYSHIITQEGCLLPPVPIYSHVCLTYCQHRKESYYIPYQKLKTGLLSWKKPRHTITTRTKLQNSNTKVHKNMQTPERKREAKTFQDKIGKFGTILSYTLKAKTSLFLSSQDSKLSCYEIFTRWKKFLRNTVVCREHFSLLALLSASLAVSTRHRKLTHSEGTSLPGTPHFFPGFWTHTATKPASVSKDGISHM